jgi:hypothetical protein
MQRQRNLRQHSGLVCVHAVPSRIHRRWLLHVTPTNAHANCNNSRSYIGPYSEYSAGVLRHPVQRQWH